MFGRSQIQLRRDTLESVDITYVSALVNIGYQSIIYNGALVDYELSIGGGLSLLYLKGAKRKELNESDKKFTDIPGHVLILKYEEIININLSFITTDFIENEDGSVSAIPRLIQ